ncbi:hypothetical protein BLA29_002836 [Euroglyphus maynei]|uniref:Dendritic cell-specific transmembrane protein-like domain-containing protein n=1 Tax=Euroglyphus maynei TaxID=6958 RepID=A0A1Y3BCV5_EURMA|nr:hypothetical protein BLA29_002836 [Euroglyphus maynei]
MPWIRSKRKPASFDIFLIRILEYIEMIIKNELPIIHRIIYRCPPDEYILVRRLFCMFGGYLVCKLLLILCIELPETSEDIDRLFIHKWGLLILIIGFVLSIQIRTVICLLLPSLVISTNGIFFYLRLLQRTQKTVSPSIIGNIRALWNQMRFKAMAQLAARPFISFAKDTSKIFAVKSLKDSEIVKENVSQAFHSFKVEINELNRYCLSLIEPIKSDDHCSKALEEFYAESNIVTRQIYNQIYDICYETMDTIGTNLCLQMNRPFEKFENLTNRFKNINLLDSLEFIKSGDTSRQINEALEMWQSLVGYRMDLEEEFRGEFEWIGLFGFIIRIVFVCTMMSGLIRSIFYHNRYLRFLNFDNHYIDRYFYHIDNKRKTLNKIHLLPLRGNDRWQLIPTFSLNRSVHEKMVHYGFQKKVMIITFIVLAILLYIDYIFSECVELIAAKLSNSDHFDLLVHRFNAKARGGVFAEIINDFVRHFHFNYTEIFRHDWHTCRQTNSYQLGWPQYRNILSDYI